MDQIKIGDFISRCRKAKGYTQSRLAEKLGITDKAISKWECGKSMPDISLFQPLCSLLGITLNELLLGEYISEENLKDKTNQVLMDVINNWIGNEKEAITSEVIENEVILKLENVQKIYKSETTSTIAINDVSFVVHKGSFVGIMGASGSGKSTLLNMIATIDKATKGSIKINGKNTTEISEKELAKFRRNHLGFIFQEYNLIDTLTIYENIALALMIKEVPKEQIKSIVYEIAEKLEIHSIMHKYQYEVSGGQRQRCACARAIVVKPDLILADEPTGALDSTSTKQLLDTLIMLKKDYGATILMVTHDALSASYCDRILFLKDGAIEAEIKKTKESKQTFFTEILETMAHIEGGSKNVF